MRQGNGRSVWGNAITGRRWRVVSPSELERPRGDYPRAPSEQLERGRGRLVAALAAGGLAPAATALVLADAGVRLDGGRAPSVMAQAVWLGFAWGAMVVSVEGLAPSEIASAPEGGEVVLVRGSRPAPEGWRPRRDPIAYEGPEFARSLR